MSRNQLEGRFVGKAGGKYKRIHAKGATPERSYYAHGDCEKCDSPHVDGYCDDSGKAYHGEYGEYWWYSVATICRECGHKSGFEDSSI